LRQQALQVGARAVPGNESVNREGSPQVMESRLMSRVAVIAQDTRTDTKPAKGGDVPNFVENGEAVAAIN
jgi:hypothetical protein